VTRRPDVPADPAEFDLKDPADVQDRLTAIEQHGIDYIPDEERASRPSNLFFILFGGSLTFSLIIIGWFPIAFGLSVFGGVAVWHRHDLHTWTGLQGIEPCKPVQVRTVEYRCSSPAPISKAP
jgi:Permease for cytosine/purines, uracil, thiamine, allantoin